MKQRVTYLLDFVTDKTIMKSLASNLLYFKEIAAMCNFTEDEKTLEKRMDRFDSVVTEYLRKNRRTVEYLAEKAGICPATLWRYRTHISAFRKAPFEAICICLRLANVSNDNLRFIFGLPTGKSDEN